MLLAALAALLSRHLGWQWNEAEQVLAGCFHKFGNIGFDHFLFLF